MNDTKNQPSNAVTAPSVTAGETPGATGTHIDSCFFNRSGGNRRNSHGNMRKKAEQNQFCSAFLRLTGKKYSHGWRRQWLNTRLDDRPESWSIHHNVTKTRYGDLARKFALAIAALSQAMTSRPLNLTVADPALTPADRA
jgi:hypothetical protein